MHAGNLGIPSTSLIPRDAVTQPYTVYLPCWISSARTSSEYFADKPTRRDHKPFLETFEPYRVLYWPFTLSNKRRIPQDIVEELLANKYIVATLTRDQIPFCGMVFPTDFPVRYVP